MKYQWWGRKNIAPTFYIYNKLNEETEVNNDVSAAWVGVWLTGAGSI